MERKAWLEAVTDPDCRSAKRDDRPGWIGHVQLAHVDGQAWSCATDGRYIVAVKGELCEPSSERVQRVLAAPMSQEFAESCSTRLEKLKAFLGSPASQEPIECDECGGSGKAVCPHCDQPMACGDCVGGKRHEYREPDPVFILGVQVNRHLLSHAMRGADGEYVTLATGRAGDKQKNHSALRVSGDDWQVVICGMEGGTEDRPKYEVG